MPPIFSKPIAINQEWAGLLTGLCMNVPSSWWASITSPELNAGAISHLDFNQENERFFQLELDEEKGIYHAMRYDAVLLYPDKSHPTFAHFHLPYAALADPTNNQVQTQWSPIAKAVLDDDAGVDGDNLITPPRNNVRQQCNMTINNYLVLGVKDGADNAGEAAANVEVRRSTPPTIYKSTDKSDRTMLKPNEQGEVVGGRHIAPILYTGGNNEFTVSMTDVEKSAMKDADGNIHFHKIFDWLLPTIGMQDVPFYEFVLARMQNYMIHIIKNEG
jgi:hypothetical protein